ncbi:SCO family protein [Rhodocyclus tenuis]|uniref:Cytochrome oxidase Cu insertion factor (SCO1/SenC/PrrC family) n=1 Tax=Rhodocyclus tenuis TaxID=1066 RepID=A0A840GGY7_RHOTE|nr:SCO family protein [Rhodocyclus tenuis]MBB4247762.1 cytochrome oxidase Cu insertion factor (SCO1/SenC/PrrC family) [Rhodocyclus tenuis]
MKRNALSDAALAVALVALVGGGAWLAPQLLKGDAAPDKLPTPACDINAASCRVALPDGGSVELSITPRPIPTLTPLAVTADVSGSSMRALALDLAGVDMDMGPNRAALVPLPDQPERFSGSTQLPICSTGQMLWQATLQLADARGGRHDVAFRFTPDGEACAPEDAAAAAATPAATGAGTAGSKTAVPATDLAPQPTDFTLSSADGPVSLRDFRGKLVLLYFGYTFCPDVCPTALTTLAQAMKQLSPEEKRRVQVIFVSVDPPRDTPQHLKEYLAFFDPAFVGVTGSAAEIAAAARSWGVYYAAQAPDASGRYSIDHSAFTALVASNGKLVMRLPHASTPADIAVRLRALLNQPR